MKDLNLPYYTKEQSEEIFSNLKKGDVLINIEFDIWSQKHSIRYYEITNKTPKGAIRLSNNCLLKYLPSSYYVSTDELKEWIEKYNQEIRLFDYLFYTNKNEKDFKNVIAYEDVLKLNEIFEKYKDVLQFKNI